MRKLLLLMCAASMLSVVGMSDVSQAARWGRARARVYSRGFRRGVRNARRGYNNVRRNYDRGYRRRYYGGRRYNGGRYYNRRGVGYGRGYYGSGFSIYF